MTLIRLVSVRLILWFFILILLPLPFIVLLLTELSMQFSSTLFGIIAGLVGYIWMLLSMYLSTRPHLVRSLNWIARSIYDAWASGVSCNFISLDSQNVSALWWNDFINR